MYDQYGLNGRCWQKCHGSYACLTGLNVLLHALIRSLNCGLVGEMTEWKWHMRILVEKEYEYSTQKF